MAKRLSEIEKKEIVKLFTFGKTIEDLSREFDCTKSTISRNLKQKIGEKKYKELISKTKSSIISKEKNVSFDKRDESYKKNIIEIDSFKSLINENLEDEFLPVESFLEIAPLNFEIDNSAQKDLSSIPISEMDFPKTVYMIVDKQIELEIRLLRDFPSWEFLSEKDLNRKTIEIFLDIKNAKRKCDKDHKVIKVPNTEVFKIVAPILKSKGISRIVCPDKLIAL